MKRWELGSKWRQNIDQRLYAVFLAAFAVHRDHQAHVQCGRCEGRRSRDSSASAKAVHNRAEGMLDACPRGRSGTVDESLILALQMDPATDPGSEGHSTPRLTVIASAIDAGKMGSS